MAKPRKTDNRWWADMGRPPFEEGDLITPNGNYSYPGWPRGEYRRVLDVRLEPYEHRFWTLAVLRPGWNALSFYNPHNFEKKEDDMAYERTQYFAVKLSPGEIQDGGSAGLSLDTFTGTLGDFHSNSHTTPLRDSRHEVKVDVQKIVAEGDRWLVVQTVCLIEGEEPRPPIRVTEYK